MIECQGPSSRPHSRSPGALEANEFRHDRPADEELIETFAREAFLDVEPWLFAALVD